MLKRRHSLLMLASTWLLGLIAGLTGCSTIRVSDSQRTATEQLLISDAIDRTVSRFDFQSLSGKRVYLDAAALRGAVDAPYLASSIRQHMLATGCLVQDKREDAEYVVEARCGTLGTDRHEMLYGIPAHEKVPEVSFVKTIDQRAVAKVALFAFNRTTGEAVWQSGIVPVESQKRDAAILGAVAIQKNNMATRVISADRAARDKDDLGKDTPKINASSRDVPELAEEATFQETHRPPSTVVAQASAGAKPAVAATPSNEPTPLDAVVPAAHNEPASVISQATH